MIGPLNYWKIKVDHRKNNVKEKEARIPTPTTTTTPTLTVCKNHYTLGKASILGIRCNNLYMFGKMSNYLVKGKSEAQGIN
jgi:hypothetical protein